MQKLLVVDDEPDQRHTILKAANAAGFPSDEIISPNTWADALEQLSKPQEFCVAVIDIKLWLYDEAGVDYIRKLHTKQPTCLIIALTERQGDDAGFRAMRAGAIDFINCEWSCLHGEWEDYLRRKLILFQKLTANPN